MEKELQEIKKMLNEIWIAIAGNPTLGTRGMVQTQADHEDRISKLERFRNSVRKWGWIRTGAIAGASYAAGSTGFKATIAKIFSAIFTGMLAITAFILVCWIL